MTRYLRLRRPGGTFFFTLCLQDRGAALLVRRIDLLRDAWRATLAELPVVGQAAVVLPDHLHAIWTEPEGEARFSERWRRIKARFSLALDAEGSRRASLTRRRERGVWQRRFWEHAVRDEEELHALLDYCRMNPVKHGLVEDPGDWPYSSFSRARMERIARFPGGGQPLLGASGTNPSP